MKTVLSLACAAALAACSGAFGDLSPEDKASADSATRDFGAAEFQARQAAVDRLVRLGPDVVPMVRKLWLASDDAEVKLRCELVMKGLADRWGVLVDLRKSDAPLVANLGPAKVTLAERETPLKDALDDLGRLSGNPALIPGTTVKDRPVTFSVKDATYWETVDQICRASGLMLGIDPVTSKPAIVEPDGAVDVGASAGPVAFKLNSGSVSRTFRTVKSTWAKNSGVSTVTYTTGVWWEERINISTVTLQFKQALVEGKDVLREVPQTVAQTVTPGARVKNYGSAFLTISGVPAGTRKFSEISGVIKVATRIGEKSAQLDDVFAAGVLPASANGVSLSVKTPVERRRTSVVATVTLRHDAGDAAISFAPESGRATFALVDPKGAKYSATVEGGRFGAKKTGRKTKQGLDEMTEEADFTLRFSNVPDLDGRWSIVLSWPDKVDMREYPFTLKDVPVP